MTTRRRICIWVLVDYENVQPATLDDLRGMPCRVIVFVGANQTKVPLTFADSMQRLGSRAEYVRSYGNGSNALDFHLAFRLGELVPRRPRDRYIVISRDTGFDPLLRYLASRGVHVTFRRIGATAFSASWSHAVSAVMEPLRFRHIGATQG